jgi:hypothetical protein
MQLLAKEVAQIKRLLFLGCRRKKICGSLFLLPPLGGALFNVSRFEVLPLVTQSWNQSNRQRSVVQVAYHCFLKVNEADIFKLKIRQKQELLHILYLLI